MRATSTGVETRFDTPVRERETREPPTGVRPDFSWLTRALPYLALGAAAFVIALLARHFIYPAYSWNRDEITYLWQTDALSIGKVLTTDGGAPNSFWPWLAGLRDGSFFSQYTVGWPIVLLGVQTLFGSPELALPFGTMLAVLGTYAFALELTREKTLALVSGIVMLASPILVLQSGIYLSYLFSLGLGLLFAAAMLGGLRRNSRLLLVVAGACLGWVLLTRPFDAVLWAMPLVAYAVLAYWRQWKLLFRGAFWVAIGFVPFIVITLAYNHKVTGSFTEFPLTAKDPLDALGFGTRRLMPEDPVFEYPIGVAVRSVASNLRVMPPFLFGGFLAVAVAAAGLWLRRRSRSTLLLLALMALFPVGYFFFWGSLLSSRHAALVGPLYFIPLFAPLCIFVAAALIALFRAHRGWAIALLIAMVAATAPGLVTKIDVNRRISEAQVPWRDAASSLDDDALVIVENSGPYLMHLNPFSQNAPNLDSKILYAVDREGENLDVIAAHSDRIPYLERTSDRQWDDPVGYHDAPPPKISLLPISVVQGKTVTLRVHVTAPGNGPVVAASLSVGPEVEAQSRVQVQTLSTSSSRGASYDATFVIDPATLGARDGLVSVAVGSGNSAEDALGGRLSHELFSYRVVDAGLEVLYPGKKIITNLAKHGPLKGTIVPNQFDNLRALDVELTGNL